MGIIAEIQNKIKPATDHLKVELPFHPTFLPPTTISAP